MLTKAVMNLLYPPTKDINFVSIFSVPLSHKLFAEIWKKKHALQILKREKLSKENLNLISG